MSETTTLISDENIASLDEALEMAQQTSAKLEISGHSNGHIAFNLTPSTTWVYGDSFAAAATKLKQALPGPCTLKASWDATALLGLFEKVMSEADGNIAFVLYADFRKSGGNVFKAEVTGQKPYCYRKVLKKVAETALAEALDQVLVFQANMLS